MRGRMKFCTLIMGNIKVFQHMVHQKVFSRSPLHLTTLTFNPVPHTVYVRWDMICFDASIRTPHSIHPSNDRYILEHLMCESGASQRAVGKSIPLGRGPYQQGGGPGKDGIWCRCERKKSAARCVKVFAISCILKSPTTIATKGLIKTLHKRSFQEDDICQGRYKISMSFLLSLSS